MALQPAADACFGNDMPCSGNLNTGEQYKNLGVKLYYLSEHACRIHIGNCVRLWLDRCLLSRRPFSDSSPILSRFIWPQSHPLPFECVPHAVKCYSLRYRATIQVSECFASVVKISVKYINNVPTLSHRWHR
jgi:hypothetical protein